MRKDQTPSQSRGELEEQVAHLTQRVTELENQQAGIVSACNRDMAEALEQQRATSEILRVISRFPGDAQPVFDMIAESAARLCRARLCFVYRFDGSRLHFTAQHGLTPDAIEAMRRVFPMVPDRGTAGARAILSGSVEQIPDVRSDPDYSLDLAEVVHSRSVVAVPMLRDGVPIGAIALDRAEPGYFPERQIELLRTFADQAVIALENARLFEEVQAKNRELAESLEQQVATSAILRAIAASPTDIRPVLRTVAESATQICDAYDATLFLPREGALAVAAHHGPIAIDFPELPIERGVVTSRAFLDREPVHVHDLQAAAEEFPAGQAYAQRLGFRTILSTPLLREGEAIGALMIRRSVVRPFTEKQIELVQTFADQAVIAIENARLFEELQARTAELSEALDQQTATADVLGVISRSTTDLQPVFSSIAFTAVRLCQADYAHIYRLAADGNYYLVEAKGVEESYSRPLFGTPFPPGRGSLAARAALERRTVHIPNILEDPEYTLRIGKQRTGLGVPLLRDGVPIGVIVLLRTEIKAFSERQIELVTTFADQAVIAIENARLFEEVQARTAELQESLEYQTATSDVLNVISRSPSNIQPVLDTIVETAATLCDAERALIHLYDGAVLPLAASHNVSPELTEFLTRTPITPGRHSGTARAALEKHTIHIPDVRCDPEYTFGGAQVDPIRTVLAVPMLKASDLVGVLVIYRLEVRPFTPRQVELVTTFADQAVIAIENARLFEEVQAKTRDLQESLEQQTATAEILTAISHSLSDTQPVFDAIVQSGLKLFSDAAISIALPDGNQVHAAAVAESDPGRAEAWRRRFPFPLTREYLHGAAILDGRVVDIPDVADAPPELAAGRQNFLASGYRAVTIMPLMRGEEAIGALSVVRVAPGSLSGKQHAILKTFANQAVIAIENTRLLGELRESLQQQTATAEVLKVISRSTFDLPTVLHTLVESAARLCEADQGTITRSIDGVLYRAEAVGFSPEYMQYARQVPVVPEPGSATGRALLEGRVVHIPDVKTDREYTWDQAQRLGGFRTVLGVPMLREGVPIGVLALTRAEARPFTEKQIELVSTFADQAAIAIENARLFEDLQARTEELSRSLNELRTAQDRLIQTEKLASLGQLTAGIAHEIKNPLNFVNNFSALSSELIEELGQALAHAPLEERLRQDVAELTGMLKGNLEKVVQHGRRADSIVKNMLLHSREGSGEHRPADINAIVEESLNLAYHGARAEGKGFNITLERSLDPAAGEVDVFPQDITRVFLNLISNGFYATAKRAREADGTAYEPTLAASTKNLGDRVEIRIRDNGIGIPPELRDKIFNPFFTTKPAGEGTGLGLSLSHDIVVKQHAGTIEVDTAPGEFTEFRIVLPRAAASLGQSGGRA